MMKSQWIWRAMAEWEDAHDLEAKSKVSRVMREQLHLFTVFDLPIFINKFTHQCQLEQPECYESREAILKDYIVHLPDLFNKKHGIVVEIDGNWHFNTKKGVRTTNQRNEDYELAGIKLIWLTPEEVKQNDDDGLANMMLSQLINQRKYFVP